jgi:hypothetical protein
MPVYRVEVKWDDVVVTGSVGDVFSTTEAVIGWRCDDAVTSYAMIAGIQHNSFGGGPTNEWQAYFQPRFDAVVSPFDSDPVDNGSGPITWEEADGGNGSAYFIGGLMAIEKDTEVETITWTSPLGSVTIAWADLSPVPDASPLYVGAMGHRFSREGAGDPTDEKVRWLDFHAYEGDEETPYHGADLTTDDPGSWGLWQDENLDSGIKMVTDNQQLSNGYQTKFSWTLADETPDFRERLSGEYRGWTGALTDYAVDMTRAEELPLLFRAAVHLYQPHKVRSYRSYDGGQSWKHVVVYEEAGKTWRSPSITWGNGRLMVVWRDHGSSAILQATSHDGGADWEVPITLPYTGTFPRHIMHPPLGLYLYFFFDGTTLKVARSSDAGNTFWDASPVTVETGLAAQQIDAEFAYDGSVLVSYFVGGAWTQKRSYDAGASWS